MRKLNLKIASLVVLSVFALVAFLHPQSVNALTLCGDTTAAGFAAPGCVGTESFQGIITGVLNVVFFLSFILVLFFLVWGGLKWVLAQGEKEGITKAREQVTNSLIGLVVILGAYLLLNLALQLVLGKSLNDINKIDLKTQVGATK